MHCGPLNYSGLRPAADIKYATSHGYPWISMDSIDMHGSMDRGGYPWISMESMEPWISVESMDTHGIHGHPWNPCACGPQINYLASLIAACAHQN